MAAKKKATKKSPGPKTKPAHGSKSEFVRGLPSSLSAKEVVAQGKERGLILSEAYVYKIRSTSKKSGLGGSSGSAQEPAAAASSSGAQSASDFVRALPPGTSAKDAVAQAKAAGINLTTGYFYTLRSTLKIAGRRGAAGPSGVGLKAAIGRGSPLTGGLTLSSRNPREQQVIEAVAALGLDRVRAILDTVQRLQS